MKTSKRNRGLSFLLALIMLVGMLPFSVCLVPRTSPSEAFLSRADQFGRGNGDNLRVRLFFL